MPPKSKEKLKPRTNWKIKAVNAEKENNDIYTENEELKEQLKQAVSDFDYMRKITSERIENLQVSKKETVYKAQQELVEAKCLFYDLYAKGVRDGSS